MTFTDLVDGDLVDVSLGGMMTADAAWHPATTAFGREFLDFVSAP